MDLENSQKTVLLIDDDRSLHQIQKFVLTKNNYRMLSAYSGEEGLHIAMEAQPDIILLDYMMPGLSGEETLKVKETQPKYAAIRNIPVIMLTAANHNEKHIRALLRNGLTAYLHKPFGRNELINVLQNLLVKHEQHLENQELLAELVKSRDFLTSLLNSFPGIMLITSIEGEIQFFSKGATDFTSHDISSMRGKYLWDLTDISQIEIFEILTSNADQQYNFPIRREATLIDYEKGNPPVEFLFSKFFDENGACKGLLCIGHDLTTVRQFEEERIEKEKIKAIAQAMATVNHEINNPLTPIIGNLSLIMEDVSFLPQDTIGKLERIQEEAEVIRRKVAKMSQISKPIFKTYYNNEMIIDIDNSE